MPSDYVYTSMRLITLRICLWRGVRRRSACGVARAAHNTLLSSWLHPQEGRGRTGRGAHQPAVHGQQRDAHRQRLQVHPQRALLGDLRGARHPLRTVGMVRQQPRQMLSGVHKLGVATTWSSWQRGGTSAQRQQRPPLLWGSAHLMESRNSRAALACAHTMPVCHRASTTELMTAAWGSAPAACIASSVDIVWHHCPPCARNTHRDCARADHRVS